MPGGHRTIARAVSSTWGNSGSGGGTSIGEPRSTESLAAALAWTGRPISHLCAALAAYAYGRRALDSEDGLCT